MAGRKPSVSSGPFFDLLEVRKLSLIALAAMTKVKPTDLYRLLDGRLKKTYSGYIGAIARELALPIVEVKELVARQRQAASLQQFAKQIESVASFMAADALPDRSAAKAYGPSRAELRMVRDLCQTWLDRGYLYPRKLKPLRLTPRSA